MSKDNKITIIYIRLAPSSFTAPAVDVNRALAVVEIGGKRRTIKLSYHTSLHGDARVNTNIDKVYSQADADAVDIDELSRRFTEIREQEIERKRTQGRRDAADFYEKFRSYVLDGENQKDVSGVTITLVDEERFVSMRTNYRNLLPSMTVEYEGRKQSVATRRAHHRYKSPYMFQFMMNGKTFSYTSIESMCRAYAMKVQFMIDAEKAKADDDRRRTTRMMEIKKHLSETFVRDGIQLHIDSYSARRDSIDYRYFFSMNGNRYPVSPVRKADGSYRYNIAGIYDLDEQKLRGILDVLAL